MTFKNILKTTEYACNQNFLLLKHAFPKTFHSYFLQYFFSGMFSKIPFKTILFLATKYMTAIRCLMKNIPVTTVMVINICSFSQAVLKPFNPFPNNKF